MQADMRDLEETVDRLLADPASQGLPLHQALAALMERHRHLLRQLERITHIADRYQDAERERGLSYCQRYERQLRQLERLLRISDRYQQIMRNLHEELRQQSTHDALTGLYNRRFMHKRLLEEAAKLDRHPDQPFAVVLADIDHFKTINDTLGHDMGDTVLTEVSRRFLSHLRQYDVCARWGGEEFLLLLPEAAPEDARQVLERMRERVRALRIEGLDPQRRISFSAGLSERRAGEPFTEAISRADKALYRAKAAGRDRIETA